MSTDREPPSKVEAWHARRAHARRIRFRIYNMILGLAVMWVFLHLLREVLQSHN